jgi:cytochrome b involved in lipid metabolism
MDDHPGGADAVVKYGGTDGTDVFDSVHSRDMLDDFTPIGPLVD